MGNPPLFRGGGPWGVHEGATFAQGGMGALGKEPLVDLGVRVLAMCSSPPPCTLACGAPPTAYDSWVFCCWCADIVSQKQQLIGRKNE